MASSSRNPRFHGRTERDAPCEQPGCPEPGEFRAPLAPGSFDGPGAYRWLCLDHVREFNTRYNYFAGMSTDEIEASQRVYGGWERETRAFSGAPAHPAWQDFRDPLEAIRGRFGHRIPEATERRDGRTLSGKDQSALKVLGLDTDADRRALRQRYSELVRRYHPDRNGGDRSHEKALTETIAAYNLLKRSRAFA